LQLKLEKIDPISGFKNVFSGKKFIGALKLALKLIIIFVVMIVVLVLVWDDIIAMMSKDIKSSLDSMMFLTMYFVFAILFIIFIFAIIDFVFVTFYYFKGLKMSKQEIKDEYKNMEGSPEVKQRIRQIQMELSSRQMLQNVPDADVVITNPTHYAVALHYDSKEQNAPKVVAKGVDFLAFKIKEIAREYSIRIIEDPSLARALYEQVDLDREIPQEFYKAVAELLRLVYSENNKE
jgi:flagellar biosynthetic protein FlhB